MKAAGNAMSGTGSCGMFIKVRIVAPRRCLAFGGRFTGRRDADILDRLGLCAPWTVCVWAAEKVRAAVRSGCPGGPHG